MKNIYIIVSNSGSLVSKVLKYFTKEEIKQMFNKEYYLKEIDKIYFGGNKNDEEKNI